MYSLRLLGGVLLQGPSGPLSGRAVQRRQLALLALLACARDKGLTRDKLIGYLWPETDGERARRHLSDALYVLRRALGEEAVLSVGEVVRLDAESVRCEVCAFEDSLETGDVEAAVAQYEGPFLDGFYLGDGGEFEAWVEAERARLGDRYATALETLAERAEEAGEYRAAAEWWKRLAAHDPYNSRVILRLMEALAAAGDPANALELAGAHEVRLREELGIEPPADFTAAIDRLKREPVPGRLGQKGGGGPPTEASGSVVAVERAATPAGSWTFRRVVSEIHRRSLWQVLLIYAGASWSVVAIVRALTEALGLPLWFPALAVVLLLVGLPLVLATAFVQEGGPLGVRADLAVVPHGGDFDFSGSRTSGARRFLTWRNALSGGVVALALWGVAATGWLVLGGARAETGLGDGSSELIVVLPFENLGPSEDEYFADGLSDAISAHLTKLLGIGVISRQSAYAYKGSRKTTREIGDELGVNYILEGTVQRERPGDPTSPLRVIPQLVRVTDDTHVWAETYDGDMTQVFRFQSDVARRIAVALRAALSRSEERKIETRPTNNLDAYEYYLRAKFEERRGNREASMSMAQRAVEIDPNFAAAWAHIAVTAISFSFAPARSEVRDRGIRALYKAVELAPDAFETYMAQVEFHRLVTQDLNRAREFLQAAEALRPNDAEVQFRKGNILRFAGRWEEAAAAYERTVELSPLEGEPAMRLGSVYNRSGKLGDAERYLARAVALGHGHDRMFSFLLRGLGDTIRARQFAEQHPDRSEEWLARLAYIHGDYEPALEGTLSSAVQKGEPWLNSTWRMALEIYHEKKDPESLHALADSLRLQQERSLAEQTHFEASSTQIALPRCWLGLLYAILGDEARAIHEVKVAIKTYPVSKDRYNHYLLPMCAAKTYMWLGDHDTAIDHLDTLLSMGAPYTAAGLRIEPIFAPLRDHPRFQALLRKYE